MRVLYDGLIFSMQSVGGISRYFRELIPRLALKNEAELAVALRIGTKPPGFAEYVRTEPYLLLPEPFGHATGLKGLLRAVLSPIDGWVRRRYGGPAPDLFHPTYYTRCRTPGVPTVVTVYDLIHERFPELYNTPADFRFRQAKAECVRTADRVLCISEATRRDVVERLGVPEEKTTVTLLAGGATSPPDPAADEAAGRRVRGKRFVLYVGSRWGYKNFPAVVEARRRRRELGDLVLLCVGGEPLSRRTGSIPAPSLQLLQVSDAGLRSFYRTAAVVVVPSLFEGFGLPVLEALAEGAVVACSNTGSLPEVAGDCAFYFDPRDPEGIADALAKAAALSGDERTAWAERARTRAAAFSWDRTADQTWDAYRRVLGK